MLTSQPMIMSPAQPFGPGARPRSTWRHQAPTTCVADRPSAVAKTAGIKHASNAWPLDSLGGSTG